MNEPRNEQHPRDLSVTPERPARRGTGDSALTPQRIAQICDRLRENAYDIEAVRAATAAAIIASGEL